MVEMRVEVLCKPGERFDTIAIEAEHVIGAHEVDPVDVMLRVSHAARACLIVVAKVAFSLLVGQVLSSRLSTACKRHERGRFRPGQHDAEPCEGVWSYLEPGNSPLTTSLTSQVHFG